MTFSGWVATLAGWYVTEIGRQPYIVYDLVRTADVVSKVPSAMIALTLALYVALYLLLIVAYVAVLKYMAEKPEEVPPARRFLLAGGADAHRPDAARRGFRPPREGARVASVPSVCDASAFVALVRRLAEF